MNELKFTILVAHTGLWFGIAFTIGRLLIEKTIDIIKEIINERR